MSSNKEKEFETLLKDIVRLGINEAMSAPQTFLREEETELPRVIHHSE